MGMELNGRAKTWVMYKSWEVEVRKKKRQRRRWWMVFILAGKHFTGHG